MNGSTTKQWVCGVISEVAFFAFLYYVQSLLNVMGDLWVSTFILWALLNISIAFCPVLGKCGK